MAKTKKEKWISKWQKVRIESSTFLFQRLSKCSVVRDSRSLLVKGKK
ncbi:hypothetical protein SNOG_14570 [Parastagonospora nodorum SN15]|uniref:Uncharacterized protein n=1 Tax=Phaeosphaeria nodorum (strain SN15 / ATCC MYA-4574 / FGSC 10173) TaxID=321614 RepID=Q0U151_PHANO|nr:hypothetical protein SNOG_14570 [Parastagonospora nodorum SN15]EAT78110.2 hypothetical protein SNOG_14570 [Parastagonospora nodorum SN15]